MKDRIKKFYNDHETFVHGVAVGVVSAAIYAYGFQKGNQSADITGMQRRLNADGSMEVRAVLKSGRITKNFHWHADK